MEHFANSRFWRAAFVALIAAIAYLGWSLAGDRSILPVAQAGGVFAAPNGLFVYTTSETGETLYAWPVGGQGGAVASYMEQWSWQSGTVTRKPLRYYDQPGLGPVYPPGGPPLPPPPGGTPGGRYGGDR
jgi:hypothetical protein